MRKILFITTRNIVHSCGELRLIKNRAEALYDNYGIVTDFLIITNLPNNEIEESFIYKPKTVVLHYRKKNPQKLLNHIKNIVDTIEKSFDIDAYTDIIISGYFIPFAICDIKRKWPSIRVYVDIHGAYEDIYNAVPDNKILKKIVYYLMYFFLKKQEVKKFTDADGFFVVSNYLKDYLKKIFDEAVINKPFVLAPCALGKQAINDKQYYEKRSYYRKKYGFDDSDIVLIYSGGNNKWQCVDKAISLYKKCRAESQKVKLIIYSGEIDDIKRQYGVIDDVIYDKLLPSEVCDALCCGDFGVLLRDVSETNKCAYPNKFLEYVNSRLNVIVNHSVVEIERQVLQYNVGIVCDDCTVDLSRLIEKIKTKDTYRGLELLYNMSFKVTLENYVKEKEKL